VHYPLYLVEVEDGYGHGQVVAVCLVKRETAEYVRELISLLVQENADALAKTNVVMTDKDFVEQQVIVECIPNVKLQLCIFHVLRGVAECNVSPAQKQRTCSISESTLYANSAAHYDDVLQQLMTFPSA